MENTELKIHIEQLTEYTANSVYDYVCEIEKVTISAPITTDTHYEKLEEFNKPVYEIIHNSLKKYKFANGEPEKNQLNHEASVIWWLYGEMGSVIYKEPCISAEVSSHHSSSKDRQTAFLNSIVELKEIFRSIHRIKRPENWDGYKLNIGLKCKKPSNKPFKSTKMINTIKDIIDHPILHVPAYTFEEDDSYVECRRCIIINK